MKLFVVSSPLILYFTQNIIKDNNFKDNILYLWYVKGNERHIDSYKLQLIEEFWKEVIISKAGEEYNTLNFKGVLRDPEDKARAAKIEGEIEALFNKHNIDEVFIGNRFVPIDRFVYTLCKRKKIKCNLVEDGMQNYLPQQFQELGESSDFKLAFKAFMKNVVSSKYKLIFSKDKELKFNDIYAVFSQKYKLDNYCGQVKKINFNHLITDDISKKLKEDENYLEMTSNKNNLLFLSQSLSEDNFITMNKEIEIVVNELKKYKEYNCYIKFHPRDSLEKRNEMIKELQDNHLNVKVLNSQIDIPIEMFMELVNIDALIGIWSAALFYATKIKPHIKVIALLPTFVENLPEDSKLSTVYDNLYPVFSDVIQWE